MSNHAVVLAGPLVTLPLEDCPNSHSLEPSAQMVSLRFG